MGLFGYIAYDMVRGHARSYRNVIRRHSGGGGGGGGSRTVYVERPAPGAPRPFRGWDEYSEYLDLAGREHLAAVEAVLAVDPFGACPPSPTGRELNEAAVRIYRERHSRK